jgi:hypothetical protein
MIEAISGSGGIMSTIAKRLRCDWKTAKTYVNKWESTKQAFENEHEGILDMAESLLFRNMQLATKQQADGGVPVETGDAKWILSRKGKARGYTERQEITGADGGPVQTHQVALTPEEETAAMSAFYNRVLAEARKRHPEGDQPVEEVRPEGQAG